MSAIDWLEAQPTLGVPEQHKDPGIANTAVSPDIETLPLDQTTTADAVGLLPRSVTGFPPDLWRGSDVQSLIKALKDAPTDGHPAMTALLLTLLLAEAEPPIDSGRAGNFLAARVEKLMELGAVDAADALLQRANTTEPEIIGLQFDVALLTGRTVQICAQINAMPHLSPEIAARIFCAARGGDWAGATLMLNSALALDTVPARTGHLLLQFLDEDDAGSLPTLPPGQRITPLQVRLYEAIGERLPTSRLPRAYATLDLGGDAGWKAQLDAAERLTSAGVLGENRLLGVYTDRKRAASGGVWDRVDAIQRFDTAMKTGEPAAIGIALAQVWPRMQEAGLDIAFADLFSADLLKHTLEGNARRMAIEVALLSPDYEIAARNLPEDFRSADVIRAIASGTSVPTDGLSGIQAGLALAFDGAPMEPELARMVETGRLGEALLTALRQFDRGADGNINDLVDSIRTLRAVGLEDTARRAALHLILSKTAS
ncbi:MAG: hypothetical protein MK160_09410 [Rhodobacteraceae bacterium]|nr:hypothetical protein [Paracoccaceae bacterium]